MDIMGAALDFSERLLEQGPNYHFKMAVKKGIRTPVKEGCLPFIALCINKRGHWRNFHLYCCALIFRSAPNVKKNIQGSQQTASHGGQQLAAKMCLLCDL